MANTPYRVSFKPIGDTFQPVRDTAWNAFTLDNTVTLTGLVIGDEYRVRVRARFTNSKSSAWGSPVSGFAAEEEPVVPEKLTTVDEAIPEGLRDHIEYPDSGPDIDVVITQASYRTLFLITGVTGNILSLLLTLKTRPLEARQFSTVLRCKTIKTLLFLIGMMR